MNSVPFFTTEVMFRLGTALVFDLLKLIFSLLFLFAPILIGITAGVIAQSACGRTIPTWIPGQGWICSTTGTVVGSVVTAGGYAAEFLTGVGVVAVETAGEVFADALDAMAWMVFFLWFVIDGRKFFGTKRSTNQLFISTGSALAGAVPFLNVAPTVTLGVFGMEYQHWQELKEKAANDSRQQAQTREQQVADQQAAYQQAMLIEQLRAQAANDNEEEKEEYAEAA